MKDHIELTTWEEVINNTPAVTDKNGARLGVVHYAFYIQIEVPTGEPNVCTSVEVNRYTYPHLKHAFRFWKRREPLRWVEESLVRVDGAGNRFTYLAIPEDMEGKRVKVTIEELPSGDDAGRG